MSRDLIADEGYTVETYLALVEEGVLTPEDRVELLEGLIVARSPHTPEHAAAVYHAARTLELAIGDRAVVRGQLSLIAGTRSVPEPDVAVIAGSPRDFDHVHPRDAVLVMEVSGESLAADRLTKSRVYAGAGVPEYWIINLRDDCVEVYAEPDLEQRIYGHRSVRPRDGFVAMRAFPHVAIAVDDLLPARRE